MVTVLDRSRDPLLNPLLKEMFEARKRVFVDLLRWDVPVIDDRFEVDQFDDEHATYIVVQGCSGRHAASARLLPTTRPHILDTLFADLCQMATPRGAGVVEITRGSQASAPSADYALRR